MRPTAAAAAAACAPRSPPLAPPSPITAPASLPRQAQAHPEVAARLSTKQAQALQLQSQLRRSGSCPASSGIPPRPHRARDAFGPGMVFVVNTVLAWLMFSIDVRNSMLG